MIFQSRGIGREPNYYGNLDYYHLNCCHNPDPAVGGAEKNEIRNGGFRGQLYPVFLCAAFRCYLALAVDAVNRTKSSPNHADVLALGQYWRTDAGDFHGASNNSVQP